MSADDEMVAFRLAANDRKAIRRLVDAGDYRNRSDFLRHAVRMAIAEHEKRPVLDLELEAVDLPSHAPARGKPRARQSEGVNR